MKTIIDYDLTKAELIEEMNDYLDNGSVTEDLSIKEINAIAHKEGYHVLMNAEESNKDVEFAIVENDGEIKDEENCDFQEVIFVGDSYFDEEVDEDDEEAIEEGIVGFSNLDVYEIALPFDFYIDSYNNEFISELQNLAQSGYFEEKDSVRCAFYEGGDDPAIDEENCKYNPEFLYPQL